MKKEEINIGPEIAPGTRVAVRRDEEGERTVVVRSLKDGEPLTPGAEVATASRECRNGWRDLTVHYRNGPAQVATPEYRQGYDRIFGKKQKVGLA